MLPLTANQGFIFHLVKSSYFSTEQDRFKDLSWLKAFIEGGASVNARLDQRTWKCLDLELPFLDPNLRLGMTPLHIVVSQDAENAVEYLLKTHADPSCKDESGRTPIFLAYSTKVFKLLLNYGAAIGDQDNQQMTVMDHYYQKSVLWNRMSPETHLPESIEERQECYSKFRSVILETLKPLVCDGPDKIVVSYLAPYDHIKEGMSPRMLIMIFMIQMVSVAQQVSRSAQQVSRNFTRFLR